MRPRLASLLAALTIPLAALRADVITLDDGRVIDGEIISAPGAAVVEVRITSGGLVAIQRFDVVHVVKIERGPSPRQQALSAIQAQRTALGDGGEAEEWMALARRARDVGEASLAKELAGVALTRDRQNPEAHKMLGEIRQNGVWMRPREAAAARGEVYFRGKWVPWGEKETILAAEEKARQDAAIAREKLIREHQAQAANQAALDGTESMAQGYGNTYNYGGLTYGQYTGVPRVLYWSPYSYGYGGNYTYASSGNCGNGGLVVNASGNASWGNWALSFHW
jgi:hypothetical protein